MGLAIFGLFHRLILFSRNYMILMDDYWTIRPCNPMMKDQQGGYFCMELPGGEIVSSSDILRDTPRLRKSPKEII